MYHFSILHNSPRLASCDDRLVPKDAIKGEINFLENSSVLLNRCGNVSRNLRLSTRTLFIITMDSFSLPDYIEATSN